MIEMTVPDKSFVSVADGSGSRKPARDTLLLGEGVTDKKSHIDTDPDTAIHSTAV